MQLLEGRVDVMCLPIGDNYTMGIEDAVRAVAFVKPRVAIPMHWGTFPVIETDPQQFKTRSRRPGGGRRPPARPDIQLLRSLCWPSRSSRERPRSSSSAPARGARHAPCRSRSSAKRAADVLPAGALRRDPPRPPGGAGVRGDAPLHRAVAQEPPRGPRALSPGFVHHEVQPQGERGHGAAARVRRAAPVRARRGVPGRAAADARRWASGSRRSAAWTRSPCSPRPARRAR